MHVDIYDFLYSFIKHANMHGKNKNTILKIIFSNEFTSIVSIYDLK